MSHSDETIKSYYEEWWENPRDPRDAVFRKLNEFFSRRLPEGPGKTALDVGSGKGTIVRFLLGKGYRVTAAELNETFVDDLRKKFPDIEVVEGDVNALSFGGRYDLVTAIEFIQNLDRESLRRFFEKVASVTDRFLVSISNKNSLHGFWAVARGFIMPFVHVYSPREIETMLKEAGFTPTFRKGIGFLTPITLFSGFRGKLIPVWLTKLINPMGDRLFPRLCHIYYLEARKTTMEVIKP